MKSRMTAILASCGMVILVWNRQLVQQAALEGMELCLQVVVPSLFPFLFLSTLLQSGLDEQKVRFLLPLAKILRLSPNAVPLLIAGYLGGYPAGAMAITQAAKDGRLDPCEAKRMLAFGSNAGPAFIFGLGMTLFPNVWICFMIWGIHIVASWIVALLTPGIVISKSAHYAGKKVTASEALKQSVGSMALICGWIMLFRILICLLENWLYPFGDVFWIRFLLAALELTNGVCGLNAIYELYDRIVLFTTWVSFGGVCVYLQTKSVCGTLGTGLYFPGKIAQACVSAALSCICASFLTNVNKRIVIFPMALLCVVVCLIYRYLAGKYIKKCSIFESVGV